MAEAKTAEEVKATDPITINYELGDPASAPNDCKATSNYKGQDILGTGSRWTEAKNNLIARAKHLKGLGDPPASEEVDLDTV